MPNERLIKSLNLTYIHSLPVCIELFSSFTKSFSSYRPGQTWALTWQPIDDLHTVDWTFGIEAINVERRQMHTTTLHFREYKPRRSFAADLYHQTCGICRWAQPTAIKERVVRGHWYRERLGGSPQYVINSIYYYLLHLPLLNETCVGVWLFDLQTIKNLTSAASDYFREEKDAVALSYSTQNVI